MMQGLLKHNKFALFDEKILVLNLELKADKSSSPWLVVRSKKNLYMEVHQ